MGRYDSTPDVINVVSGGTVGHLVQAGNIRGGYANAGDDFALGDNPRWQRHSDALDTHDPHSFEVSKSEGRALCDLLEGIATQDDGSAGRLADKLLDRLMPRIHQRRVR
ncbi:hypothetical protein ABR737_00535 [Streptomyces sp. Edi2]|uniref:hypothetical protein n=1 Tax=Streptomyces sp. Edi2 TaxID=3162528 RepID=UPI003305D90F